ncbi:MAG: arylesterase [Phycisphaerales bacterium]|nr:arylesterase [Hyphomonadaceae bacterium]
MDDDMLLQDSASQRFVLVLLGDSLTQGYGLSPQQALSAQLQRVLDSRGAKVEVRNAGVSGETSAQGLMRFDRATTDVDGVVIQFGGNDMLQGRSPVAIRADLSDLVARARTRKLWVGLVGMKAPPIAGAGYRTAFDRIYRNLAEEHVVPLYPFYFEGLIDAQTGSGRPEFFLDRVHPSAQGVVVVAAGIANWLTQTLPPEIMGRRSN